MLPLLALPHPPVTRVPTTRDWGMSSGRSRYWEKSDTSPFWMRRIFSLLCCSSSHSSAKNALEHLHEYEPGHVTIT